MFAAASNSVDLVCRHTRERLEAAHRANVAVKATRITAPHAGIIGKHSALRYPALKKGTTEGAWMRAGHRADLPSHPFSTNSPTRFSSVCTSPARRGPDRDQIRIL